MPAKYLEFASKEQRATPPKDYLVVMTTTAKTVVKAYTPEAAAQIARQRLDQGDAAFSDAHIVELTEVMAG